MEKFVGFIGVAVIIFALLTISIGFSGGSQEVHTEINNLFHR